MLNLKIQSQKYESYKWEEWEFTYRMGHNPSLPTYLPTLTAFDIVPMPRAFKANKSWRRLVTHKRKMRGSYNFHRLYNSPHTLLD